MGPSNQMETMGPSNPMETMSSLKRVGSMSRSDWMGCIAGGAAGGARHRRTSKPSRREKCPLSDPGSTGSETRRPALFAGRESYGPDGGRSGYFRLVTGPAPRDSVFRAKRLLGWYLDWHAPGDDEVRRYAVSRFAGSSGVVAGHWARISLQAWCDEEARGRGVRGRGEWAFRRAVAAGMRRARVSFGTARLFGGKCRIRWLGLGGVMSQEQGGEVAAPLRRRAVAAAADFLVVVGLGLVLEEALRVVIVEGVGFGVPPGLRSSVDVPVRLGVLRFLRDAVRRPDHREDGRGAPHHRDRGRTVALRALRCEGPPVALRARAAVRGRGIR